MQEWQINKLLVNKHLEDILKISVPNKNFNVYLAANKIGGGKYLGNQNIYWGDLYGNDEKFTNYNMIYLIHEALHSMFNYNNLEHAVIELISDNELNKRLNNETNSEYGTIGHANLLNIRMQLLDSWKDYLNDSESNIYDFIKTLS